VRRDERPAAKRRFDMPGRNKQRSTFEKRQREISRREKQAEKRARRQGKAGAVEEPVAVEHEELSPEEAFRRSLGQYPSEVDAGRGS
jgi:hypothetical protein